MNSKNVFINCPFDNDYFHLLKPLLFTIIYIDLIPKISETKNSGNNRLELIKDLMIESKYSIHDLSRSEPMEMGDYPRFNMPFECGIDFGLKHEQNGSIKKNSILILVKEYENFHRVMSDIGGNDVLEHYNQPIKIVKAVRDWFRPNIGEIPYDTEIWRKYNVFQGYYEEHLKNAKLNPHEKSSLTFSDIIGIMSKWIGANRLN